MSSNPTFLIWSGEKKAWWKAEGQGYSKDQSAAGRFTTKDLIGLRLDGTAHLDLVGHPSQCDVLVLVQEEW